MTMAHGGAVGWIRIPARKGFSPLAIAGSENSSLTLVAIRKGYHEVRLVKEDVMNLLRT
jgi:hypothetical protein